MTPYTVPPRLNADLHWLGVDLDGTLSIPAWPTGESVSWPLGDPIVENVAKLKAAVALGWKIVIHTARPWSDYELIETWLTLHEIPFNKIVCGKLLCAAYIDDRAIHPSSDRWYPAP